MLLFGHVGTTIGVTRLFNREADARKVALASIAADLIDKPIGLLYPGIFGNNTRLAAHTLIACLTVCAVTWIFPKLIRHQRTMAFAYLFHMVLDRSWRERERVAFLWPFLGPAEPWSERAVVRWWNFWRDPYLVAGELVGLAILLALARKYRLFERDRFREFSKRGVFLDRPAAFSRDIKS